MLFIKSLFSQSADKKLTEIVKKTKESDLRKLRRTCDVIIIFDIFIAMTGLSLIFLFPNSHVLIGSLTLFLVFFSAGMLFFFYIERTLIKSGAKSP